MSFVTLIRIKWFFPQTNSYDMIYDKMLINQLLVGLKSHRNLDFRLINNCPYIFPRIDETKDIHFKSSDPSPN